MSYMSYLVFSNLIVSFVKPGRVDAQDPVFMIIVKPFAYPWHWFYLDLIHLCRIKWNLYITPLNFNTCKEC